MIICLFSWVDAQELVLKMSTWEKGRSYSDSP